MLWVLAQHSPSVGAAFIVEIEQMTGNNVHTRLVQRDETIAAQM